MKFKIKYILLFFIILFISCKKSTKRVASENISPKEGWVTDFLKKNSILLDDKKLENSAFNFSSILLNKKTPYKGFIGSNKQKLDFDFEDVRNQNSNSKYDVTAQVYFNGITKNVKGLIDSISIYKLKSFKYGFDDVMYGKISNQGIVIARYTLKNNNSDIEIFEGQLLLRWYVDNQNILKYDDIGDYRDGYSNNQFYGYFLDESNTKIETGWGHYRIPNLGDLDVGAGEFSVNPKYLKYGWGKTEEKITYSSYNGSYSYYEDTESGDSRLGVSYKLNLKGDEAIFSEDSYFGLSKYLCTTKEKDKRLDIKFKSLIEGEEYTGDKSKPLITIYKKGNLFYAQSPLIEDGKEIKLEQE